MMQFAEELVMLGILLSPILWNLPRPPFCSFFGALSKQGAIDDVRIRKVGEEAKVPSCRLHGASSPNSARDPSIRADHTLKGKPGVFFGASPPPA